MGLADRRFIFIRLLGVLPDSDHGPIRCLSMKSAAGLFLICALAAPSTHFTRPAIVAWQTIKSEEDLLRDELRKHPDIEDVFITPKGEEDRLKEYGWEKAPFTISGKEVWIQRKPKTDRQLRDISWLQRSA